MERAFFCAEYYSFYVYTDAKENQPSGWAVCQAIVSTGRNRREEKLETQSGSKVRGFLFTALVAILLCILGLLVVVFHHMGQVKDSYTADQLRRQKAQLVETIRDGVYARSHIIPYTAVIEDFFDRYDQKDAFDGHAGKVSQAIFELGKVNLSSDEQRFFNEMRDLIATMQSIVNEAMDVAVEAPESERLTSLMKETGWRQRELQLALEEFSNYSNSLADGLMNATNMRFRETEKWITFLAGGLMLSALIVAVMLVWYEALSRRALITAVEERTKELQIEKDRAQVANRAKTEFLSSTSHELRTPLNAIIGFANTLSSGVFGPLASKKQAEYINDIEKSGTHLLNLINDILDVSAIEAGQMELHKTDMRLEELAESCLRLVNDRAQRGDVKLINSVDTTLPDILADERRLKQIILNLLSNAVKFTPGDGSVELTGSLDQSGNLLITVRDSGIGMDEAGLEKAMTPFGQVDGSLARQREGTGLGLPLTLGLVELHGGTMEIESTPLVGTTISVRLPQPQPSA